MGFNVEKAEYARLRTINGAEVITIKEDKVSREITLIQGKVFAEEK